MNKDFSKKFCPKFFLYKTLFGVTLFYEEKNPAQKKIIWSHKFRWKLG